MNKIQYLNEFNNPTNELELVIGKQMEVSQKPWIPTPE